MACRMLVGIELERHSVQLHSYIIFVVFVSVMLLYYGCDTATVPIIQLSGETTSCSHCYMLALLVLAVDLLPSMQILIPGQTRDDWCSTLVWLQP